MKQIYQKNIFDVKSPVKRRFDGFTLIELLVVVLIIGILAAIALPQYEKAVEKSRAAEAMIIMRSIADANRRYYMATGEYTDDLSVLDIEIPGTDSSYQGQKRKETKFFEYSAKPADMAALGIALANRLPRNSFYSLHIRPADNKIYCNGKTEKGVEFCKSYSTKMIEGTYYVIE